MSVEVGGTSLALKWALAAVLLATAVAAAAMVVASLALINRTQASDQYRFDTCQRFNVLYAGFRHQFDQARSQLYTIAYWQQHPVERQRELDLLTRDEAKYAPIDCRAA